MSKDLKSLGYADIDDLDGPFGTMGLTNEQIDSFLESLEYPQYLDMSTQCECGKDKHGFANHSTWCPKHE